MAAGMTAGIAAGPMRKHFLRKRVLSSKAGPDPDLTIVLLGQVGVGKSASGNTILGRSAFESGTAFGPMTKSIRQETGQVSQKQIRVIDTPGVLESEEELKTFCRDLLRSSVPLLFLVVVRVGRFTDEEHQAVQAAIRVLGENGLANSFLLFTGGDGCTMPLKEFIYQSKRSLLQDVVKQFGDRYHLFNNEAEDQNQVKELLEKFDHLRTSELPGFTPEGVTIVLLGNTAVGKSASGNTILGKQEFESKPSLKPVTTGFRQETARRFGKLLRVIDTPGILGSEQQVQTYCEDLPQSHRPLLFLLVIRVGRFTEEEQKAVEAAIRVIRPRWFENSYLLFTGGDALKGKPLQNFISEDEGGSLHQLVQRFARRTHLFNNEDGGREQVRELLQKAANCLVASLSRVDRRLLLIGLCGGGRSSAGNTILGSKQFLARSGFEPVTSEVVCESAVVEGHRVTVVDTPGFSARDTDPHQISERFNKMREKSEPGPHAVVFVVRIGRMSREDSALIKALTGMFESDGGRFSMVLFTHGDELRGQSINEMIQSNSCVKQLVSRCEDRFCVFDNTKGDRWQVREFLSKVDELVTENRGRHWRLNVWETGADWQDEERSDLYHMRMFMHRDMEIHWHRHMGIHKFMHGHRHLHSWVRGGMGFHFDILEDDSDSDSDSDFHTLDICCQCFCRVACRLDEVYRITD